MDFHPTDSRWSGTYQHLVNAMFAAAYPFMVGDASLDIGN
jgi:hypothetical protein